MCNFPQSRYILTLLTLFDVKSLPERKETSAHDDKIKAAARLAKKSMKIGLKETESNRVSIADDNEWC